MKTGALFVEDERWGVGPYFEELEKNEFECVLAKDGDVAIEKLNSGAFDLVSMDISFPPGKSLGENVLPITAGLRLLEMIRAGEIDNCDPKIKVIILTAVLDSEIETRIKKLGVDAYLKKPIEFDKVIDTFRQIRDNS